MAPTAAKYEIGDLMSVILIVAGVFVFGFKGYNLDKAALTLWPLIVMLVYVLLQSMFLPEVEFKSYSSELIRGFIPFFALYILSRNLPVGNEQTLKFVVFCFVVPGLVQCAYIYFDIAQALIDGRLSFGLGYLEFVKDTPRVGRRYASVAMLHFLAGGVLMAVEYRAGLWRSIASVCIVLSLLSLVLLDARAAYASVLIGLGFLLLAVKPAGLWSAFKAKVFKRRKAAVALCLLFGMLVAVGFSTGYSRYQAMGYSVEMAVKDVLISQQDLTSRPYVNSNYWSVPPESIAGCFLDNHIRCKADQSAYLRTAWLIVGFSSLIENPLGVGYQSDYFGRLWGVLGEKNLYQRSDSFLVEQIVSFGFVGVVLYCLLWLGVAGTLRVEFKASRANASLIVISAVIFVCFGRGLVDMFSEGLWRYLMALLGMYYGLLYKLRFDKGLA